ncbi:MAG: hypothetical protein ACYC08_07485, partial [Armatimonadota bacterium]
MSKGTFRALVAMSLLLVFAAAAHSDMQIERPMDGSTVRETVSVLVPVWSVPSGGFVAYTIDGEFICAQSTKTKNGENFVYYWNTKGGYRDGQHRILVEACDSNGDKTGERREINVFLKNTISASDIPYEGLKLRY